MVNPTFEDWLSFQADRKDSVGYLARAFRKRPARERSWSFNAWVIATQLPINGTIVDRARLEFIDCAARIAIGRRSETYPSVLLRNEQTAEVPALFEFHSERPNIDPWKYLDFRHHELEKWVKRRLVVYLDTNHWLNLRDAALSKQKALPIYKSLLQTLSDLAGKSELVCPVSFPLFCEVLQQTDEVTRYATADLMQKLSSGVCLSHPDQILQTECRGHLSRALFPEDPCDYSHLLFTKVGFLLNQELLTYDDAPPETAKTIQKVYIDLNWESQFSDLIEIASRAPRLFVVNHEHYAVATDGDAKWYRENRISLHETWGREAWRIIQGSRKIFEPVLKGTFQKHTDRCVELISAPIAPERNPRNFPSIQVLAGVNAFMIHCGKKFKRNDMLDFEHASIGVPYCDIFCCDKPMAATLNHASLNFGPVYKTKILAEPHALVETIVGVLGSGK